MGRIVFIVIVASLSAGCAVGRKQEFDSARVDVSTTSATINVAVVDHRPYVLSHDKTETFTGLSRGGYGNPFDVNTKSGQPLATDMANSVATSLRTKGATVNIAPLPPSTSDMAAMAKLATPEGKGCWWSFQNGRATNTCAPSSCSICTSTVVDIYHSRRRWLRLLVRQALLFCGLDGRSPRPGPRNGRLFVHFRLLWWYRRRRR